MATDDTADVPAKKPKRKERDTTVYGSGAVRVFTDWTFQRLRAAERMAENGDLYQAVTICEWLLTDDRIVAALDARLDALMGLEPSFEEGTGRRSKQATKALEVGEDFYESYPESEQRQMLRWGLLLGGSLHRHNWTERKDHGGRMLPMPTFWHPQTLKWDWHTRQLTVRDSNSVALVVTPGDGEWVFHTPHGLSRFWAHGLWRSLSRLALLKQLASGDWSRHSSKGSQKVATAPEGTTEEERAQVAASILSMEAEAVLCMPIGYDCKLLEVEANTEAIYKAQIELANNSIAITIRGGNLTTSVDKGAGSKAATEAQAKTGDEAKLRFDAASLSTTLHDQSLNWWAEYNFGDSRLAPWPMWPVEPEEDKSATAATLNTGADGLTKMAALGFEIDPKGVMERFGWTDLFTGYTKPEPVVPVDPDASGAEPGAKPNETKAPKEPKQRAHMAAADTGHLDGQLYVDDVRDDAQKRVGRKLKAGLIGELLEVIQSASGYDEIRGAVLDKYRNAAPPEKIREYIRCALVMSALGGGRSVHIDMED